MTDYEIRYDEETDRYEVWDVQLKSMQICLATCNTKGYAEHKVKQYQAVDTIEERTEEFVEQLVEEFDGILTSNEVRESIKSYL